MDQDISPALPTPPYNTEAEHALLAALLHNNALYERVSDFLRQEHFYDPLCGRVYALIGEFIRQGRLANPITLYPYLQDDVGFQAQEGGAKTYLSQLAGMMVSFVGTGDYGRQIYDLYLRRQLMHVGEALMIEASKPQPGTTAAHPLEKAEKALFDLATQGQSERGFSPFEQALAQALETAQTAFQRDSHLVGVTTGLLDLDRHLGGLHPSDLIILAGRPSMGKTALATSMAFHAAYSSMKNPGKEGAVVAFFSLEMSSEQLALRLLGQESGISSDRIRRGAVAGEDFLTFMNVTRDLSALPLYIDDTPALSVAALHGRARRLQRQVGLGLIVIDYLQLISGGRDRDNRVQELSEITRSLKALAKELNVPVLALSQLSRAVEQREDKRPQLADLRESGSIEQDADVVMFIYRDEYYEARKKPAEGSDQMKSWQERMAQVHNIADIDIAKQRHGPIGRVRVRFDAGLTKFSNLADNFTYHAG